MTRSTHAQAHADGQINTRPDVPESSDAQAPPHVQVWLSREGWPGWKGTSVDHCGLTGHSTSPRHGPSFCRPLELSFPTIRPAQTTPAFAVASVVPCASTDGRRPAASVREQRRWCFVIWAAFRQKKIKNKKFDWVRRWQHCPIALVPTDATLCRRTERHHTAACIPQPTRCDTAACPGGMRLGPVAVDK